MAEGEAPPATEAEEAEEPPPMEGTATLFVRFVATVPAKPAPDASVDAPPAAVRPSPASPPLPPGLPRAAFPLVPSERFPPGARARDARVPARAPTPARSRGS